MAGTKINTKSKGKDDKSKGNKSIITNEENEDHDFSLLRKPILTSITGFAQARKIFDFATEELKSLLANECDLLYECKVCRNIFRSLANLISHKRVYCKEKFSSSVHSHFVKNTSAASEMLKIKQMEEAYQESLKVTESIPRENDDRIPLTKDLTGIMEKLSKIKGRYNFDEQQVTLQRIPNNSIAVFQSHSEENKFDNMQAQVHELDSILSQDNAVLQRDGSFNMQSSLNADKNEDSDNVIQISDDDDSDEGRIPKCKICDMQFSTQKTLKFHMKYKHLESRLVYPCPDCFEIFSTSWSVYRHLFKVHRKSAAQIRRLREAIQAKAFRMNNPPAIYEKKKNMKPVTTQKISEEERLDQENQAWMDNMEGDGELPRCGGCGRTFERRAALAAHTHTCQPRLRALARRPDARKIEIQIRKDYNKGPPTLLMPKADTENKVTTVTSGETQTITKTSSEKKSEPVEKVLEQTDKNPEPVEKKSESAEKKSEIAEKIPEPTENELVEATMDIIDDKSSQSVESPDKYMPVKPIEKKPKIRLPFAHQTEKSNLAAFKQRMQTDIDMEKLLCKKCDTKHVRTQDLFEHMAGHYKWMRYACKLCNYKNYDFEKLPEHVKIVHKLKGDSDFYFSTVKAIDGTEALELAEPIEESDVNEESSDSRRQSRCSSDSSRLSDDSSSSSTRVEFGARKRKMYQNRSASKRRKEATENDELDDVKESDVSMETNNVGDSESPSNIKTFEENSSDMEDLEEKMSKRHSVEVPSSVASRRPVRKKTKPKNADFEYDLSNLLKMEAQGYRDSQIVTTPKPTQTKKKIQQELQSNYDNINKDHIGAMALLSKKAVDKAAAELKTTNFSAPIFNIQQRISNIFARPMLPKISRGDKISPKKDSSEELKDGPSLSKVSKVQNAVSNKEAKSEKAVVSEETTNKPRKDDTTITKIVTNDNATSMNDESLNAELTETVKTKLNIPAVVPIKFRRQSLELMNNPIINKNITDFSKAGMKTKILLIKPINRNKDGIPMNSPLKFQTIKLKEPNKGLITNEEKSNDQIVVVKVPKVERKVVRNIPDSNINNKRALPPSRTAETAPNSLIENKIVSKISICPNSSIKDNSSNASVDNSNINANNSSKNGEQMDANSNQLTLDQSEIKNPVTNNVDKTDSGIKVSSNVPESSSNTSVLMDTEESVTTLEASNDSMDTSMISVKETNDCESKHCITESKINQASSILDKYDKKLEDVSEKSNTVYMDDRESCIQSENAISLQESVNSEDSAIKVITNGDITQS